MHTDTTVRSLRICSFNQIEHRRFGVQMELVYQSSTNSALSDVRNRAIITNITCTDIVDNVCNAVFEYLLRCPNTATIQRGPNPMENTTRWCQPCSNYTVTECPTTTPDPPKTSSGCPTSPSDVTTLSTESEVSSQTSIADERDSLKVIVTTLGVLVGILVILLAVMISGWVWTCWTMKRNKATTTEHVRYRKD